jgi:hypothetical protein
VDADARELLMRTLSPAEIADIKAEEGLKPPFIVAEDHNIEAWRVRAIWNEGMEIQDETED